MKTRTAFETVAIGSLPPHVLASARVHGEQHSQRSVLVVDDDRRVADTLVRTLQLNGFDAEAVYTGEDGLKLSQLSRPDVIITDVGLPGLDGISLAETISRFLPSAQILFICECLPQNAKMVKWPVLKKPVRTAELLALIGTSEVQYRGA